eukprot:gene8553-9426_t
MAKKFSSDEQAMIQILHSMGIEDFEANVPAALNDFARRLAAELLCDAQDYAVHAGRQHDIQAKDVTLAQRLSDGRLAGLDHRDQVLNDVRTAINKRSLTDFADPSAVLLRYPKAALVQRAHSYQPAAEAYGDLEMIAAAAADGQEEEAEAVQAKKAAAAAESSWSVPSLLPDSRDKVSFSLPIASSAPAVTVGFTQQDETS